MAEPFGGVPSRWLPDGPSRGVAIVLPGSGYSPSHPMLEFARQALLQYGWTVQQVWWTLPTGDVDGQAWVEEQARAALATEDADEVLLVAKSLGTRAAAGVPDEPRLRGAIWFTPLTADPALAPAFDRVADAGVPQLLVGSTADESWDAGVAARLAARGASVLEVGDVTHFFNRPGDAVGSVEAQLTVSRAVDDYLRSL